MAFTEYFTPFMDLAGFAVEAIWLSPVVGVNTTVKGIFDNGYGDAFDGQVGAQQPTFLCESAIIAAADQGDSLSVNGTDYTVLNIEPDGTGMTTLRLRKV